MKILDSPASTILVTNSDGARYDICCFSPLRNVKSEDDDVLAIEADRVDRHAHRGILDAAAGEKAEMLLVDGRSDDDLAIEVAHDAAGEHVRTRKRIAIADRMEAAVAQPEHGDLLAI